MSALADHRDHVPADVAEDPERLLALAEVLDRLPLLVLCAQG
ncbi:hypothetical protein ACIQU6_44990 [Streptomyces sp. NPDC090442]